MGTNTITTEDVMGAVEALPRFDGQWWSAFNSREAMEARRVIVGLMTDAKTHNMWVLADRETRKAMVEEKLDLFGMGEGLTEHQQNLLELRIGLLLRDVLKEVWTNG